jgi:8-oxo-dGTP diphosphatase
MIQVAAAIIQNSQEQILICKRGPGGSTAFLWEFPGGKREVNESLTECLIRECQEELRITISVGDVYATTSYKYPENTIDFVFFKASIQSGELAPTVHDEVLWVRPDELTQFNFCPADIDIIERLICKK